MGFEKLSVPSVREQFVRDIENKILSGELQIGEKLPPARELCGLMGVSLTTVSTGITELCNKGFIEVKPRHGAYVADYIRNGTAETFFSVLRYDGGNLKANEIRSFTESRMALDPYVTKLVIERAGDEQIGELAGILDRLTACTDNEEACELITEFYHDLYQLSDNSIFSLLYKTTMEAQKGMYALYFAKNGLDYVKECTAEIYKAIAKRDYEAAREAIMSSLESVVSGEKSIIS